MNQPTEIDYIVRKSPSGNNVSLLNMIENDISDPWAYGKIFSHLRIELKENRVMAEFSSINLSQTLKCGFRDLQSISLLAKMTKPNTVIISTELNIDIANQVVKILKNVEREMIIQLKQRGFEFRLEWQPPRLDFYLPHQDPIDLSMLASLSELQEVRYLTIRGTHLIGSLTTLFRSFGASESTKLQEVVVYNESFLTSEETSAVASIKSLRVLECGFAEPRNIEELANATELRELCISCLPQDSIKGLFSKMASKKLLQYLKLTDGPLDCEEAEELAKIESLKYLACSFEDVESLERLGELPHLKFAYITVKQREYQACVKTKHLLSFLGQCQKKGQVRFPGCCVTFHKPKGSLILAFKSKETDDELCFLLGELGNIKNLKISGRPSVGNLEGLLKSVALDNKLEFLKIDIVKANEIPIVAQMENLSKITVGFYEASNLELLANLPHLKWLSISEHPRGSLENLFYDLAVRKPPSQLETLTILGDDLVPEELAEVSRIGSLRRLRCGLVHTSNEWSLTQLSVYSMLEELNIRSNGSGSLDKLFMAIQAITYFRCLIVQGCRLSTNEVRAIRGIQNLKTLHCGIENARDIGILERLPLLEELIIKGITLTNRNPLALLAHKERQTLKKLVIKSRSLGVYDFKSLALISSLQSLDFIIHNARNIGCLALLNLTELILNCPQKLTITPLITALLAKDIHVLSTFKLTNKLLKWKPTRLLMQIRSLRNLKVGFSDLGCFNLVSKKTDLEILEIKNKNFRSKEILKILKNCRKLREIHFPQRIKQINTEFISQCMDILKTVRNPREQNPLQMYFHSLHGVSLEQQYSVDESYLILNIKERAPFDDFNDEIFDEQTDDAPQYFFESPESVFED
ncbi:internalin I-like [Drosophila takahashii]|uniref:internalin I-like n=1 Tax=Drosophila takahashii TaxID=29030 RepID=UPI0038995178